MGDLHIYDLDSTTKRSVRTSFIEKFKSQDENKQENSKFYENAKRSKYKRCLKGKERNLYPWKKKMSGLFTFSMKLKCKLNK